MSQKNILYPMKLQPYKYNKEGQRCTFPVEELGLPVYKKPWEINNTNLGFINMMSEVI